MHQRHWQKLAREQYEDIQRLQHALTELTDAVAGRALGDEPNCYEDYDELTRLIRQARAALIDPVLMAERALEKRWDCYLTGREDERAYVGYKKSYAPAAFLVFSGVALGLGQVVSLLLK